MKEFFSALIEGMTPKQKGGLIALLGGFLLSGLGLAAVSDSDIHIGPDGLDFTSHDGNGGASGISLPDDDGSLE